MIKNILLVGLGGGAGSIARYLFQRWALVFYPHSFPWATFLINALGCFVIGIIWGFNFKTVEANETWKLLLMTGLCGGFTTFSAFTLESIGLLKEQKLGLFFLYIAGSVLTGLLATYIGIRIIK
jgi:CrcB protein